MHISAIVAMSENRVIGRNNQLPWHLPADLRHFKQITMGHPIVMGRKTYASIGRALPGRRNVIISHNANFQAQGCEVFNSIDDALFALKDAKEIFVIGGAQLFEKILPSVKRLYLTVIHADISGDVFFPVLDSSQWKEIAREDHLADGDNEYAYSFITLDKI